MKTIFIVIYLAVLINTHPQTIKVPQEISTIQANIDSSASGDFVLVSPGTYYENINFNGKNIVLGSLSISTGDTSYISQTIIDGNQLGCVVVFESDDDNNGYFDGSTLIQLYVKIIILRMSCQRIKRNIKLSVNEI